LWTAFVAIHAHPVPGFAVVVMAYTIGALGGSIPLPAVRDAGDGPDDGAGRPVTTSMTVR
jgi:hypothetical protein